MCARYTLRTTAAVIEKLFEVDDVPVLPPRFNIAPSQAVLGIVEEDGVRAARLFQWGLVPSWAKDLSSRQRLINARSETLSEKPAFRAALRYRRCLIPADGYYEWRTEEIPIERRPKAPPIQLNLFGNTDLGAGLPDPKVAVKAARQPYWVHLDDDRPFAFAGLWERWSGGDGSVLETCAILTTEPSERVRGLHDRMPAILTPESWGAWLDVKGSPAASVQGLLRSYEGGDLVVHRVTTRVNSVVYDAADCVSPV